MLTIMLLDQEAVAAAGVEERQAKLQEFWSRYKETKAMIRAETGLNELDRLFGAVTKAKHSSDYVDLWRKTSGRRTTVLRP